MQRLRGIQARRRRCVAGIVAALALAGTVGAAGTPAHASVTARTNCGTRTCAVGLFSKGITVSGVSCTSTTSCVMVGSEAAFNGGPSSLPLYAIRTSGGWRADTLPQYDAAFSAVSCTSSLSDCTAIGQSGGTSSMPGAPLVGVRTSAGWSLRTFDGSGVPEEELVDVSCAAKGTCTAVGGQGSPSGLFAVYMSEAGGVWGGVDTAMWGLFDGVSCPTVGRCTAVGYDGNGDPAHATEAAGKWRTAPPNATTSGGLDGISCVAATDCTAVGGLVASQSIAATQPFFATETNGTWGPATVIPIRGGALLYAVSCAAATSCTAVGVAQRAPNARLTPLIVTERGGVWGTPIELVATRTGGQLVAVSCPSATRCTAVGTDSQGFALYPTEVAGAWPRVPSAPRGTTATPGNGSIDVAWTAPASNGGAPVAGYSATAVNGQHAFSCTVVRTGCTIRGLTNGTSYVVTVVARNASGSSAPSGATTVTPHA